MAKKRIYELSKEINVPSKDIVTKAKEMKISVKNHMSSVSDSDEAKLIKALKEPNGKSKGTDKIKISKKAILNSETGVESKKQNNTTEGSAKPAKKPAVKKPTPAKTASKSEGKTTKINNTSNTKKVAPKKPATDKVAEVEANENHEKRNTKRNELRNQANRSFNRKFNKRRNKKNKRNNGVVKPVTQRKDKPLPEILEYNEGVNVATIAKRIHREPSEIIKKLFLLGVAVNQNQSLDDDTVEILAADYGIEAHKKEVVDNSDLNRILEERENSGEKTSRPPVITIMGHVDHGKTTLLDYLRHSQITEGEAGGITQHIGAYQVKANDQLITFLDTPGHAAFTNMRARGADITDIVIIVAAADDGIMPQTIEAINHAKASDSPIIVAINKIDKPDANPGRVKDQMMEYGLIPEEYGGDTIFVEISARQGTNIDDLLEMIILQSEIMELKASQAGMGTGVVIEAYLDKGKGPIASLLVTNGQINVGDAIVVGSTFGRVRSMVNDRGQKIKSAGPSTPVRITGLNDVPEAADQFAVFEDEKSARAAGEKRAQEALESNRRKVAPVNLDNLFDSLEEGEIKKVNIVLKADVQGSVEAIANSLDKIEVEGVKVDILHKGVGAINDSDIALAEASDAIVVGFNVRPTAQARKLAESEHVDIRTHKIIYQVIDEIESAMKGMLEPVYREKVTGNLTVRETFKVSKVGTIAGAIVNSGFIQRNSGVRLIRNGIVIFEGKLASLKRFKDDVKEVRQGFECGITIEDYDDIKVDDEVEAFIMEEVEVN